MDTGSIVEGRAHYDQAIELYQPSEHHSVATRFGQDARVSIQSSRSLTLWLLGYPVAALRDSDLAVKHGRETGQAAALMYALGHVPWTYIHCGHYTAVNMQADELVALAEKNGTVLWRACGLMIKGCVFASTGEASKAIDLITSGMAAWRSTRQTNWIPLFLSYLALAHAELSQFDEAWRCIGDAIATMETTKERWCKAEVHRTAGTIALMEEPDATKAEASFYRALAIARDQQAKSWELRSAMSMARLWRDQDKRRQARDLLAPVYGWFTEGFDTLDLKEAKALLTGLHG
jgi:predicted ATPase